MAIYKKIGIPVIYRNGLIIDKTKTISDEEIKEHRKKLKELCKDEP